MTYSSDANSSRQRISTGTRLNGIFEIDRLIGVGGMGEIYKGHTIETGDPVAIKLMLPELAENDAALALFRKEASALHHLMHEAIVRYYVFTVEPVLQRPYLAMEFVDGRSLSDILQTDGPLPFESVRALTHRVATGLHAAHERGIIHRDVSPDNIIAPDGNVARAKIIDFGIARSTNLKDGTVIGSGFAGKYNYVSPEQLGLYGGDVTAKSDIYSLGLVLVQVLTGVPIDMGGSQVQVIEKRRRVPDLSAIDARFRPLIEKMLQPDPADRPESMAAVATWQLDAQPARPSRFTLREPKQPKVATAKSKAAKAARSGGGGWRYALTGLLLVLGLGAVGGGYYFYADEFGGLVPSLPSLSSTSPTSTPPLAPSSTSPPLTGPAVRPPAPSTPTQPSVAPPRPPGPSANVRPDMPPAPSAPSSAERVRRYVEQYDGGDCFFIVPVAIGEKRAAIEGYGAAVQPFNRLDEAFKRDIGFSADIGVRQVAQPQCPAITFLAQLRHERGRAPRLDLDKVRLRSGEVVNGTVERFGSRNVALLLVSDTGTVQNVSSLLKQAIDAKTFSIGMQHRGDTAVSLPQLLVVVTSTQPLRVLQNTQPVGADQLFPALLKEAADAKQELGVTARYFRLER